MAPAKRSSAGSPRGPGRPAKAAKVAVDETMLPVFELLSVLAGLTPPAHEMLRAAVPHALATTKDDRHELQVRMLQVVNKLVENTEETRGAAIREAKAAIAEHQEKQKTADTRLVAAKEFESKLEGEKVSATETKVRSKEELASAVEKCSAEKKTAEDVEGNIDKTTKSKSDFEQEIAEAFIPAKNGEFAPKDWRQTKKAVARVVSCLQLAGAPASLGDALQIALKEKPEVRTQFSAYAVDHCQKLLEQFVHATGEQIENLQKEREAQLQVVANSEGVVTAATSKHDAHVEAALTAEMRLSDATVDRQTIEQEIEDGTETAEGLESSLADAGKVLVEFQDLSEKFAALRDAEPKPQENQQEEQEQQNPEAMVA